MTSREGDVVEGSLRLVLELWRLTGMRKRWQDPQLTFMMAHSHIISNRSDVRGRMRNCREPMAVKDEMHGQRRMSGELVKCPSELLATI